MKIYELKYQFQLVENIFADGELAHFVTMLAKVVAVKMALFAGKG